MQTAKEIVLEVYPTFRSEFLEQQLKAQIMLMENYAAQFGITKGLCIVAKERAKHLENGKTPKHDAELYFSDKLKNAALFLLTGMAAYYPRYMG